jgi:TolB-like protein
VPNSIAVLPFANRSPDTADAYLAEGMTEEVSNQLARLGRLQVRAPSQAAAQWRRTADALEAGRRLNVAWVVEGHVRHVASQLQVSASLLRVGSGEQVWGGRFARSASDVFTVQAEVAESVAAAVVGRLLPAERAVLARRPTRSNEAYRLYLFGNSLMARRTPEETQRAVDAYVQALQLDSAFAGAWARLGFARGNQYAWVWPNALPRESLLVVADAAARRALAMDSTLADTWLAVGQVAFYRRDIGAAFAALQRGLRLDSTSGELRFQMGAIHSMDGWGLGVADVGTTWFRRALAVDPTLRNTWRHLALIAEADGKLDAAEARWDTALVFGPWAPAFRGRAWTRLRRGDARGALEDVEEAERLDSIGRTSVFVALREVVLGDSAAAQSELARLRASADSGRVLQPAVARLAVRLGLRAEALAALERYRATPDSAEPRCAPGTPCSVSLRTWKLLHDPFFAPLRGDPRFERLWNETRPRVPWLEGQGR